MLAATVSPLPRDDAEVEPATQPASKRLSPKAFELTDEQLEVAIPIIKAKLALNPRATRRWKVTDGNPGELRKAVEAALGGVHITKHVWDALIGDHFPPGQPGRPEIPPSA